MAYPSRWWSKSAVFFVSLILGIVTAQTLFDTPNVAGGGEPKMVAIIVLTVLWKVLIEFFLRRSQRRKDKKRDDMPVA
jgi:hypothetical protein